MSNTNSPKVGSTEENEICIVSQFWIPDVAGDAVTLKQRTDALRELGWKVTLITTKPHYPEGDDRGIKFRFARIRWEDGIKVVRIAMPRLSYTSFLNRLIMYSWFSFFASIYSVLMARGPLIWAFSMKIFSTYAVLPARLVRRSRVVSEVTDVWPEALVNTGYVADNSIIFFLIRKVAGVAYQRSKVICAMTDEMQREISSRYSLDGRVIVVPYVGRERPRGTSTAANSSFTLLYFGNLGANYDISAILDVASRLRHNDVRVVIRGDGERLQETQQRVAELSLTNVTLITRILSEEELGNLESSADALILPMAPARYPDASFPGKFVDYLQAGKPIIYIGSGLPASLVREYGLGFTAIEPDISAIAEFILTLKRDPALRDQMGTNARSLASARFNRAALTVSLQHLLAAAMMH